MAGWTGLEPAASAVTGQRSNQLNYDPNTERSQLRELVNQRMAGSTGLEPAASAVTGQRSNQLNYDPKTETLVTFANCHVENAFGDFAITDSPLR